MLTMNHVAAGAIVGLASPSKSTAALTGFMSHFVLDSIPHWGALDDPDMYRRVAVRDGLIGIGLTAALTAMSAPQDRSRVLIGALAACLPDSDKPNRMFFGRSGHPQWFRSFHQSIQIESSHRMRQEWMVAAGLVTAFAGLTTVRAMRLRKRANAERVFTQHLDAIAAQIA